METSNTVDRMNFMKAYCENRLNDEQKDELIETLTKIIINMKMKELEGGY